jgi:hypothetical protein
VTSIRARAYHRVIQVLRDVAPAKLWPAEEACIREAADAMLFCQDLATDGAAREAVAAVAALRDDLVDASRWTPKRAQRMLDDVWSCGPEQRLDISLAA